MDCVLAAPTAATTAAAAAAGERLMIGGREDTLEELERRGAAFTQQCSDINEGIRNGSIAVLSLGQRPSEFASLLGYRSPLVSMSDESSSLIGMDICRDRTSGVSVSSGQRGRSSRSFAPSNGRCRNTGSNGGSGNARSAAAKVSSFAGGADDSGLRGNKQQTVRNKQSTNSRNSSNKLQPMRKATPGKASSAVHVASAATKTAAAAASELVAAADVALPHDLCSASVPAAAPVQGASEKLLANKQAAMAPTAECMLEAPTATPAASAAECDMSVGTATPFPVAISVPEPVATTPAASIPAAAALPLPAVTNPAAATASELAVIAPVVATAAAVATKCCASAHTLTPAQLQKPEQCEEKAVVVQPQSDAVVVQPQSDAVVVQPQSDAVVVQPQSDAVVLQPQSDAVVVQPQTDAVVVQPQTDAVVVQPQTDARTGNSDDSNPTQEQLLRRQAELAAMFVKFSHKWLDRSIGSTATPPKLAASTPAAAAAASAQVPCCAKLQHAKGSLLSKQQDVGVKPASTISAACDSALGKEVDNEGLVRESNNATNKAVMAFWKMASPYSNSDLQQQACSVTAGTTNSVLPARTEPAAIADVSPAPAAEHVQQPAVDAYMLPFGLPMVDTFADATGTSGSLAHRVVYASPIGHLPLSLTYSQYAHMLESGPVAVNSCHCIRKANMQLWAQTKPHSNSNSTAAANSSTTSPSGSSSPTRWGSGISIGNSALQASDLADAPSAPASAAQAVVMTATNAENAVAASVSVSPEPEDVQAATWAPDAADFATEICELLVQEFEHAAGSAAGAGSSTPSRSGSGISIGSCTSSVPLSGGGDSSFSVAGVAVESSQLDSESSFGSNSSSSMPGVHSDSPGSSDQGGTEAGKHATMVATSSSDRSKSKACIDAALSGSDTLEQPVPLNPFDNNTQGKYGTSSSSMWSHTCGPPVQTRTACWENARHIDSAANPAAAAAGSRWGACNCRVVLTQAASWGLSTQQQHEQDDSLDVMQQQQHQCLHFSIRRLAAIHNAFEIYVREWIQREGEGEAVVEAGPPRGMWRPEAVAARAAAAAAAAATAAAAAAANAQSGAAAAALAGKAASSGASKRRRSQGSQAASANNRRRS
jgi:hypothetical protein